MLDSTTTVWCTPDEMTRFYDARLIALLCSDSNTPVNDLNTSQVLQSVLRLATAQLESIAYRGKRYTRAELQDIYSSNTVASELLKYLVASLALRILWMRRSDHSNPPIDSGVDVLLEKLNAGEMIFPLIDTMNASFPKVMLRQEDLGKPLRQLFNRLPDGGYGVM